MRTLPNAACKHSRKNGSSLRMNRSGSAAYCCFGRTMCCFSTSTVSCIPLCSVLFRAFAFSFGFTSTGARSGFAWAILCLAAIAAMNICVNQSQMSACFPLTVRVIGVLLYPGNGRIPVHEVAQVSVGHLQLPEKVHAVQKGEPVADTSEPAAETHTSGGCCVPGSPAIMNATNTP